MPMAAGTLMEAASAHSTTPHDRVAAARRRDAGQEQAHHDGVVVGAADEGQQGQRVEHGEHEGGAGVAAERAGQLGDAVGDQRDADDRLAGAAAATVISAWWKLSEADQPASMRKSGP